MMRLPSASGCAMSRPLAPGNTQALKFVEAETDAHKLTKNKMNNSRWRGKMVIQDIRTVSIHAQGACLDFPPGLDHGLAGVSQSSTIQAASAPVMDGVVVYL